MAVLQELREEDADEATANIYADIRHLSALPQVNLIYRHLATLPGVLEAVWTSISPWIRSSEADRAVANLLSIKSSALGRSIATTGREEQSMRDLLGVYGRGNVLNILALSAVKLRLEDNSLPDFPTPPRRQKTLPIPILPKLPRLNALPAATAAMVAELTELHEASLHGVTPSLYLHLAHWPGLLQQVRDHVRLYARTGKLAADRALVLADASAYGIAAAPMALNELPIELSAKALSSIDLFTRSVIPDLIAVGRMLSGVISNAPATS